MENKCFLAVERMTLAMDIKPQIDACNQMSVIWFPAKDNHSLPYDANFTILFSYDQIRNEHFYIMMDNKISPIT